jgi:hypothetical protein
MRMPSTVGASSVSCASHDQSSQSIAPGFGGARVAGAGLGRENARRRIKQIVTLERWTRCARSVRRRTHQRDGPPWGRRAACQVPRMKLRYRVGGAGPAPLNPPLRGPAIRRLRQFRKTACALTPSPASLLRHFVARGSGVLPRFSRYHSHIRSRSLRPRRRRGEKPDRRVRPQAVSCCLNMAEAGNRHHLARRGSNTRRFRRTIR